MISSNQRVSTVDIFRRVNYKAKKKKKVKNVEHRTRKGKKMVNRIAEITEEQVDMAKTSLFTTTRRIKKAWSAKCHGGAAGHAPEERFPLFARPLSRFGQSTFVEKKKSTRIRTAHAGTNLSALTSSCRRTSFREAFAALSACAFCSAST